MRPLSLLETRVLGVLIEKAHTVPDSYPLSLNSLTLGCNQKTARDPVLAASEADVQSTIDALKSLHLAFEASGSRVSRYEHNLGRALALPSQSVALLATLMLRGVQTASELRVNSERLHRFADLSSVEGFLDELAARAADKGGPLAVKLPRTPGAREARWAHLLGGPVDTTVPAGTIDADTESVIALGELAGLKARLTAAEAEIARLRPLVDKLCSELGLHSVRGRPDLAPGQRHDMRFDLPDDKTLTFEMVIPIRWGDMDAMGHVNNTVYFRYLESVRIEWLHRINGAPDLQGDGPVIVNAFCNFIRQLKYPGDVLARHYVASPGRTSFDTFITLERVDEPGVIAASGGSTTVWVNYAAAKSVPLPESLRAVLERSLQIKA